MKQQTDINVGLPELGTNPFKKQATYFHEMDSIVYLVSDSLTVSERIDPCLTLIWDRHREKLLGFKLKGFKHLFLSKLKKAYALSDEHFFPLVTALEIIVTEFGNRALTSEVDDSVINFEAYKKARDLANRENAVVDVDALDLAA